MQRAGDVHGAVCDTLAVVRIASTEQIAALHFADSGSPLKRASQCLVTLERSGLVEGQSTGFGRPKVWRLTKRARDTLGLSWRPPVLFSRKTAHWLALTDCYRQLCTVEKPLIWIPEYREDMEDGTVFSPDVWCVWRKRPVFIEVQLSDLTADGWRQKWKRYEWYYAHLAGRKIQPPGHPVKPTVVVLSRQHNNTLSFPACAKVIKWLDFTKQSS